MLNTTVLTIATFRNDEAVADLLEVVCRGGESPFHRVIVVDSLGTGEVEELVKRRRWRGVDYVNSATNLGSAGNLRRRLELAAAAGADYAYAINHDGQVDLELVAELVSCAETIENLGAAYPLHFYSNRDSYDQTGTSSLPLPFLGRGEREKSRLTDVTWSSSNGALYAMEPVRRGLLPDDGLWMGWEDMAYGWELAKNGYRQVLVNDTVFDDDYEYRRVDILGRALYLTDKPAWYTYYQIRNLLLIADRNESPAAAYATVAGRILIELGLTTAFRPQKLTRYRYLAAGLLDGLRGRQGRWVVP